MLTLLPKAEVKIHVSSYFISTFQAKIFLHDNAIFRAEDEVDEDGR